MSSLGVYIVILNYNGWQDTIECLESLMRLVYTNYQIVIVDNHSQDNSIHHIQEWAAGERPVVLKQQNPLRHLSYPNIAKPFPLEIYKVDNYKCQDSVSEDKKIVLICSDANLGFAGGNNIALKYILKQGNADYVWLLNNDTVVEPNSLSFMIDCYKSKTEKPIGIVGCKLRYYHHPSIIQCMAGSYYNKWLGYSKQIGNYEIDQGQFDNKLILPDLINGASMLVSLPFLNSVGLLNEQYFLYFEEQDWAERAKIHNFILTYSNQAIVYHKEGMTIGGGQRRGNSRFSDFYFTRSKLLFTERYFNKWTIFSVKMSLILTVMNRLRRGQFDRVPMIINIIRDPHGARFKEAK